VTAVHCEHVEACPSYARRNTTRLQLQLLLRHRLAALSARRLPICCPLCQECSTTLAVLMQWQRRPWGVAWWPLRCSSS
jgi:hypothetical protein